MNVDDLLDDPTFRREYEVEMLLGRVADAIDEAIEASGFSKQQVADALGVTPGRVSQIVSGDNLTLRTIAETSFVIGARMEIFFSDLKLPEQAREDRYRWTPVAIESDVDEDATYALAA